MQIIYLCEDLKKHGGGRGGQDKTIKSMEAALIRGLVTFSQRGSTQTYLEDYVDCI